MNLLFKSSGNSGSVWVRNISTEDSATYDLGGVTGVLVAGEVRELALSAIVTELNSDGTITVAMERAGLGEPMPEHWRVSRDTIWQRLKTMAGEDTAHAIIDGFTSRQRTEWFSNDYFWSDNPNVRGLCAALGIDADGLLDRDLFFYQ